MEREVARRDGRAGRATTTAFTSCYSATYTSLRRGPAVAGRIGSRGRSPPPHRGPHPPAPATVHSTGDGHKICALGVGRAAPPPGLAGQRPACPCGCAGARARRSGVAKSTACNKVSEDSPIPGTRSRTSPA